jgi:hypothetical protein
MSQESMNSMDAQENNPFLLSQESLLLQEWIFTNDESKNIEMGLIQKDRKRVQEEISNDTSSNSNNRNVIIPYDQFLSLIGNFVCAQCHGMETVSLERLTWGITTSISFIPINVAITQRYRPNYGPPFISTKDGRTKEELILCLQYIMTQI